MKKSELKSIIKEVITEADISDVPFKTLEKYITAGIDEGFDNFWQRVDPDGDKYSDEINYKILKMYKDEEKKFIATLISNIKRMLK